jgi:hypothetical protein
MISDDELRTRLSKLDPLPTSVPVDPYTSPRAQDLLERVMTTQTHDQSQKNIVRRWRKPALLTGAAAAVIALGIVAISLTSGGPAAPTKAKTTVALKIAGGGTTTASASCIQFSIAFLREMSTAFSGTVTKIDQGTVTLVVDHWYRGGTAEVVTLTRLSSGANVAVSIDGVSFAKGKRYLVTATNGTVNSCGFTGVATPELEKVFAEAFPRS